MGRRHFIRCLGGLIIACFFIQSACAQPFPLNKGKVFSVEIRGVAAWCDHMPGMGAKRKRQHLMITVELENLIDRPIQIQLRKAQVSFDKNEAKEGAEDSLISLVGKDGRASGQTEVALGVKEKIQVKFRGDNIFKEGQHQKKIYVTATFAAEDETLTVRNAGVVMVTH